MDSSIDTPVNPFLNNALNSLCIACNQNLENIPTVSIYEILPHIEPETSLFEGFSLLTEFSKLSNDEVPQRACKTCFLKTSGCLRFQSLCITSVYNIKAYILQQEQEQEETKCKQNDIDIDIDIGISEECSTSLNDECDDNETYVIEVVESNIEPIDIKEDHQPQQTEIIDDSNQHIEQSVVSTSRLIQRRKMPKEQRIECKTCHKWFARYYIKYHERLHTGESNYQCTLCEKAFVLPGNYYSHMHHCHKEGYPFLCNQCGRGFKRGWILRQHIRVQHNQERPYECKICGKAFKSSHTLKEHSTTHSDERPFQCEKCPKRFALRKTLRQHSVTHAEVRPIACEFCDKRFTQQHCLRSHQEKTCEGLRRTAI